MMDLQPAVTTRLVSFGRRVEYRLVPDKDDIQVIMLFERTQCRWDDHVRTDIAAHGIKRNRDSRTHDKK